MHARMTGRGARAPASWDGRPLDWWRSSSRFRTIAGTGITTATVTIAGTGYGRNHGHATCVHGRTCAAGRTRPQSRTHQRADAAA